MLFKDFLGHRVDYEITCGLEEWKDDKYLLTDNYYRLEIGTEKMQNLLKEKTGKTVPLNKIIALEVDELEVVKGICWASDELVGSYGSHRAKAFDTDCFWTKGKDGLVTEEETRYDYKWNEL